MPDTRPTRRDVLKGILAAGAAAALPSLPSCSRPNKPITLAELFKGVELTDQYGKKFNPAELYKDKPVAVMFGYGGCTMCQKIGRTAVAIQKEAAERGTELPIIVVSVKPEHDRFAEGDENPMRNYIGVYQEMGAKQTRNPNADYESCQQLQQNNRILHVVTTQNGKAEGDYDWPQVIQRRLMEAYPGTNAYDPSTPGGHSRYITLFKNGRSLQTEATLPTMGKTDDGNAILDAADVCAKKIINGLMSGQQPERKR